MKRDLPDLGKDKNMFELVGMDEHKDIFRCFMSSPEEKKEVLRYIHLFEIPSSSPPPPALQRHPHKNTPTTTKK